MPKDLTVDKIKETFEYKDGLMYWRSSKTGVKDIKKPAGTKNLGYCRIAFNYKAYFAHRLVWIMHNGDIPEGLAIDHINRIRDDNRIENLRLATRAQNAHNSNPRMGDKRTCIGVTFEKRVKKWIARITVKGVGYTLGYNKSFFEACCLRKSAEIKYREEIWGAA